MRYTILCLFLLIGAFNFLHAQDKIVQRNGRTIEVKVHRITETHVQYIYPGETSVFEQPKTAISYILYADGRRESFDGSQRTADSNTTSRPTTATSDRATTSQNNRLLSDDEFYWQDVKTTFAESDVRGMTRINRISASSTVSYRDAIQQLKQKAASLGGTTILVMDVPENEDIEIIAVVYRDEKETVTPRGATTPVESATDAQRRRIAQQSDRYSNESSLEFNDFSRNPRSSSTPSRAATQPANTQSRETFNPDEPDAVYLINGRVVKGIIEELDPDDFVSIRTANGRINEYSMDEVRRISQTSLSDNRRPAPPARNVQSARSSNNDRYSSNNRASSPVYNDDYYSESGYKGIFDAGYNLAIMKTGEKSNIEFNTSHGYQINEYLFAGAGLGLHIYSARDPLLKSADSINFPQYVPTYRTDSTTYLHAVDSSYMTLPLFLDLRGYLPLQNSNMTPFIMLRIGYAFNLSDSFGGMGMYFNGAAGVKFQLSPAVGLNVSVGYAFQNYGGIPKDGGYGYYYYKDNAGKRTNTRYEAKGAGGVSLKIGIEF